MNICHDKDYKGSYNHLHTSYMTALQRLSRQSLATNMTQMYAGVFHTALPFLYVWASKHEGLRFNFYKQRTPVQIGLDWEHVRSSAVYHAERRCNMGHGLLVYELGLSRGSYKELFTNWPNEFRTALLPLAVDPYYLTRLIDMGDYKILITNKTSPEFFNRLSLLFPFLFPELNIPILMELVKAYTNKTEDEFLQLGNIIIRELEDIIGRTNTVSFWENFFAEQQEQTRALLYQSKSNAEQEIAQLNQRLTAALQQLNQACLLYYGFDNQGTNQFNEIIQYVSTLPAIQDVQRIGTGKIVFTFSTPCRNYDYELVKQMLNNPNPRSFWHKHKYPLSKIFIEERDTLYLGTMLQVDFGKFALQRAQNYTDASYTRGLPSPHFYVFDCWGMNKKPLLEALQKQDYIRFFTHLISAAGNLNFSEAGNQEELFTKAADQKAPYNKPCVKLGNTDTFLTWAEYLHFCQEEQANENA